MNDVFNSLFSFQITKAVCIHYGNLENADKTRGDDKLTPTHIAPSSRSEHFRILLDFHETSEARQASCESRVATEPLKCSWSKLGCVVKMRTGF